MNFTKKNYLALLAATLLAAPAISAADNLIEIQDPADLSHKETVDVSIYEGDPAAGTKSGPQQCFALKAIGDDESNNRWVAMKKPLPIDSAVRYRFRCSLFAEGEASISVTIGLIKDAEHQVLSNLTGSTLLFQLKPEDGQSPIKAPTGGWVAMEAIVGPGGETDWPAGAAETNIAINIKAEPGTVVYMKDLSAEEIR